MKPSKQFVKIELCRKYPERITYVYIKAFDEDITREAHEKDWPFGEAVTKGARSARRPACPRCTPSSTP